MRRDQFLRIKSGRLDRLRRHMFDADLTPKQRTELRKEVRRRERLGNDRVMNKYYTERVNASIRGASTPKNLQYVAKRYQDGMTPNQRANIKNKANRLRRNQESKVMTTFQRTKNYKALLKALRELRKTVMTTKNHMTRRPIPARKK